MRVLTSALGMGRIAIGAALVAAPALAGRVWVGADAQLPATQAALRAAGGRDLAIGFGIVATGKDVRQASAWLLAAATADAFDALATALSFRHLPPATRVPILVIAMGTAAGEVLLARRIRSSE